MDALIHKSKHRHVREIPLAPVLDLLTVVVFFLILSTSFNEFTKQTLPPSATSTVTSPVAPPPTNPKLLVVAERGSYRLALKWSGAHPGQSEKKVIASRDEITTADSLQRATADLVRDFKINYKDESSLQIGLGPSLSYQFLVSVMDGAREILPEIILISSAEAVAIGAATAK